MFSRRARNASAATTLGAPRGADGTLVARPCLVVGVSVDGVSVEGGLADVSVLADDDILPEHVFRYPR